MKIKKAPKKRVKISKKEVVNKKKELAKRKKTLANNVKEFKDLLAEKDNMNDLKYFKNEIDLDNQKVLIDELKQINQSFTIDKPYRIILLESDIPQMFKIAA